MPRTGVTGAAMGRDGMAAAGLPRTAGTARKSVDKPMTNARMATKDLHRHGYPHG